MYYFFNNMFLKSEFDIFLVASVLELSEGLESEEVLAFLPSARGTMANWVLAFPLLKKNQLY